ncbi:MAG: tetratricopeptide repeat protein [Myxococcales bacterium]|nr:tetratricopeptide repeat protein [Myxococcales bacterium]
MSIGRTHRTHGTRRTHRSGWFALVLAGGLAGSAGMARVAHAETPPWSVGVTDAKKAEAQKFLEAGNALFLDRKYAEALEKYKSAVGAWDHPAIRFNIVRCLIQLDHTVEASDNLKQALKYGAAPLEEAVYTEALAYDKLLSNQIGDLTVSCLQPDVKLTLDGQPLTGCPGKETRRVSPGPHQLVGTKAGLLTKTVEVMVLGGKAQDVPVKLEPLGRAARIEHRWPTYLPWVVFGAGFAVAGIGAVLDLNAKADMDSYDRSVAQFCSVTACGPDDTRLDPVRGLDDDARFKNKVAVSVLTVGIATIATGAVMLYLNRGRTVYPESVEKLTPQVTPVAGGATFSLTRGF